MMEMRRREELRPPTLEFDPYVPFTAYWHDSRDFLDTPLYVVISNGNGCVELKFHPHSGDLVEVVLVAAAGMRVKEEGLSPEHSGIYDLIPNLRPEEAEESEGLSLDIEAYRDYLCISFGEESIVRWVGVDPVLFGQSGNGELVSICVRWEESERESLLTGS